MNKSTFIMVFLLSSMLIFSLTSINSQIKNNQKSLVFDEICDTINISYKSIIRPVINTYCAIPTCHKQDSNYGDYTTFEGLTDKIQKKNFLVKIFTGNMPPSNTPGPKSLSECEKKQILKWVRAGAPNN